MALLINKKLPKDNQIGYFILSLRYFSIKNKKIYLTCTFTHFVKYYEIIQFFLTF